MLSNIKTIQKDRGFTIVELLIVIVVIGILAAITIVAYNGISNRAKTTKAQATASSIVKKMEAYNAEIGNYPATFSLLTSAASSTTYYVAGSDATFLGTAMNAPTDEKTINYYSCATPTGYRVAYWKYDGTPAAQTINFGGATTASTCTIIAS